MAAATYPTVSQEANWKKANCLQKDLKNAKK